MTVAFYIVLTRRASCRYLYIPESRDALFVCARNRKDKRDRACRQDEFIVRLDSVCIGDDGFVFRVDFDDCFTGIQLNVVFFVPVPIV